MKNPNQLKIIALDGFADRAQAVQDHIRKLNKTPKENYLVDISCVRFSNGEGKVRINESVRDKDLFIIADVGNYSCTYKMYGTENRKSPDDHFADIKRAIGAVSGKQARITVVMPLLYQSRQDKRTARESLDCATALKELAAMNVRSVITFDAHNPGVQNAIPFNGFDSIRPTVPMLKEFIEREKSNITKSKMIVVSPDLGAVSRTTDFASMLGLDVGIFYKRRDFSTIVNGKNPIAAKVYTGASVKGKTCIITDDMIATGDSVIEVATELKRLGARETIVIASFGLFNAGIERFDAAHKDGIIKTVYCTNLSYVPSLQKPWLVVVDLTKLIALVINTLHNNGSLAQYAESRERIKDLLETSF